MIATLNYNLVTEEASCDAFTGKPGFFVEMLGDGVTEGGVRVKTPNSFLEQPMLQRSHALCADALACAAVVYIDPPQIGRLAVNKMDLIATHVAAGKLEIHVLLIALGECLGRISTSDISTPPSTEE